MHYLHWLKQLHVEFISTSSFHFMVQLQNDFILKLRKEKKKNLNTEKLSRGQTHFKLASERYICIAVSQTPES